MKERLKLRSWVKATLIIIILYGLFVCYLFAYSERITRIENNENTKAVSVTLRR